MPRSSRRPMLFSLVLLACAQASLAQVSLPPVTHRAAEIRAHPRAFLRTTVAVEGYVTQYVDSGATEAAFYYLKDDWGGLLRVQTRDVPPGVGRRYRVTGRVTIDTAVDDALLVEEAREELPLTPAPAPTPAIHDAGAGNNQLAKPVPAEPAAPQLAAVWLVTGVGAALAILALVVALTRRHRTPVPEPSWPSQSPAESAAPALSARTIEGRTIRMHAPPPNTVKIMPGWLEVLSDDGSVKQVLFYRNREQAGSETTFGRLEGPSYTHVQLKSQTVSARQAKVLFEGATALLTNLASPESNPTQINGRPLGTAETSPLSNGDVIAMGDVQFRFHQR
jgi:pSer/pThr/pTyr-binding forkhead associated (FHA) protein